MQHMKTQNEAEAAITALNGFSLNGNSLNVEVSVLSAQEDDLLLT